MEYVLSLKFISGIYIKENNIHYNNQTLVCDCIDFLDQISEIELSGKINDDFVEMASYGFYDEMIELINKGANTTLYDDLAICSAAENGYLKNVEFLIENGACYNENNDYPIKHATSNGHYNVVEYLLSFYPKEHYLLANKNELINIASICNHTRIIKLLVLNGVNPSYALGWAMLNVNKDLIKFLIEHNADIYHNDFEALYWAFNENKNKSIKNFNIKK